jgi:hypothetical protein
VAEPQDGRTKWPLLFTGCERDQGRREARANWPFWQRGSGHAGVSSRRKEKQRKAGTRKQYGRNHGCVRDAKVEKGPKRVPYPTPRVPQFLVLLLEASFAVSSAAVCSHQSVVRDKFCNSC